MPLTRIKREALDVAMAGNRKLAQQQGQAGEISLMYRGSAQGGQEQDALDEDWVLLAALIQAGPRRAGAGKKFPFGGKALEIYENEGVEGDALELFPGAALDLRQFQGSIQGSGREALLTGRGGMLVVAPPGSENAALAPVQELALTTTGEAYGRAEKTGTGKITFHEPGKRYLSTGALELRGRGLFIAEGTQYAEREQKNQTVKGVEITESGISEGTANDILKQEEQTQQESAGTNPQPEAGTALPENMPPAAQNPQLPPSPEFLMPKSAVKVEGEQQILAELDAGTLRPQADATGAADFAYANETFEAWFLRELRYINIGDISIPHGIQVTRRQVAVEGLRNEGNIPCADSFTIETERSVITIKAPRYDLDSGTWLAVGKSEEKKVQENTEEDEEQEEGEEDLSLIDIVRDPEAAYKKAVAKLKEDAADKREEIEKKLELARLALSMSLDGKSQEAIGTALKEAGYEEEGENQSKLLKFKWDATLLKVPIYPPFVNFNLSFEASGKLDKRFEKPSLGTPDGMQMSAALVGNCALGLRASVEAGLPYIFTVDGGIKAEAKLSGEGANEEIIKAMVKAPMQYNSESRRVEFAEQPEANLEGGIELTGSISANVDMKSKIFFWEKELVSYNIASWKLAELSVFAKAKKGDKDITHPFSNWQLESTNLQGEAFGKTVFSKYSEKNKYGLDVKEETVLQGAIDEENKYKKALRLLDEMKAAGMRPLASQNTQENTQFQGMTEHARELENTFLEICNVSDAKIALALGRIEQYAATREYRGINELIREKGEHERRQKLMEGPETEGASDPAKSKEATEEARKQARKEIEKDKAFDEMLRKRAKFQLYLSGKAGAYEEERRTEATKEVREKQRWIADKIAELKITDKKVFNDKFASAYWDSCSSWHGRRDKMKALARMYALPSDLAVYEESRLEKYAAEDQAKSDKRMKAVRAAAVKKGGGGDQEKLKAAYTKQNPGDFSWIEIAGVQNILDFEREKIRMMKAGLKGTPMRHVQQAGQPSSKRELLAVPEGELYRSASKEELVRWERSRADVQAASPKERQDAFDEWIVMLQTDKTGRKNPGNLEKNIKPFLTLDILLEYEEKRLGALEKGGAAAETLEKHKWRIEKLKAAITVRDSERDAEKRQAYEREQIEGYFQGNRDGRRAGGFINELRVSRNERSAELMRKGLQDRENRVNLQNPALQFLYDSEADQGMGELELVRTYFRDYRKEKSEQAAISDFLREIRGSSADRQAAETQGLARYKNMKAADETQEDGALYSHQEILERLEKSAAKPAEEFVAIYLSMGGGKAFSQSDFCKVDIDSLTEFDRRKHGESWQKHNERLNALKPPSGTNGGNEVQANPPGTGNGSEVQDPNAVQRYEEMVEGDRTVIGANFFNEATLKGYIFNRLTPALVEEKEQARLDAAEADYRERIALVGSGSGLAATEEEQARQREQFEAYLATGTEFGRGRLYGDSAEVDKMVGNWRSKEGSLTDAELADFEAEQAARVQAEIDRLNAPIRTLNEAVNKLTAMIDESKMRIEEVQQIQADPNGYFAGRMAGSGTDALAQVGEDYRELDTARTTAKLPGMDVDRIIGDANEIMDSAQRSGFAPAFA